MMIKYNILNDLIKIFEKVVVF